MSRLWIIRIAIFVITFVAFARLTQCSFTFWDDEDTISENPHLNPPNWSTLKYYWTTAGEAETMALYVPVTYTLWTGLAAVDRRPAPDEQGLRPNPVLFHTANVILHSITAVLVFQLLLKLFGNEIAAILGALVFALHPVQVEPVGWASGTKDLLFGFFAVTSLLCYVCSATREQRFSRRCWYLLGILLFVLGMLSKPTAVMVPLIAAVISILLLNRSIWKTTASLLPWFVLMVPCLIWTRAVQPPAWVSPLPAWVSPVVAADALAFYFYKLLWPIYLCIDYGRNPPAILADHQIYYTWIVPVVIASVLVWKFKRARPVVAGFLIFLLPLIPVLGFVPFEFQLISTTADHYLYLPMLGVAVAVTWLVNRQTTRWVIVSAIAIIALLFLRTVLQESIWQDTRTLYANVLKINPRSTVAHDGMGYLTGREARVMKNSGHPAEARALYEKSIQYYKQSLEISPGSVPSMYNLALNYKETGQTALGRELAHRIVEYQPALPPRLRADPLMVARLFDDFGDFQGEVDWLKQVLERGPVNVRVGLCYQKAEEKLKGPATAQ